MDLTLSKYCDILDVKDSYTRSLIKIYAILHSKDINECIDVSIQDIQEEVKVLKHHLKKEIEPYKEDNYKSLLTRSLSEYITLEDLIKNNNIKGIVEFSYDNDNDDDNDDYRSIWGYRKMLEERQQLLNGFPQLFQDDDFDYDKEIEKVDDPKDKQIIMEEKQKEEFRKTYNFDYLLIYLSGNDISKIDKILEMNIVQIFRLMVVKQQYEKEVNV